MSLGSMVLIGTSLGGLEALAAVLGALSSSFPWPVVIVQHRSAEDSGNTLTAILQHRCALPVCEAEDKDPILGGRVYVAPSDYHLLVERDTFALSTEARVSLARPSIDVLFDSAAASFDGQLVGVVLTGASFDGARGAARVKAVGGVVLVQDPRTAESPVMPEAAIAAVNVDAVLPLAAIGERLNRLAATR